MTEISERYARVADSFTARVRSVTDEQWTLPTPCSEWTVRDLVGHVVGVHRRVFATLRGTEPEEVPASGDLTEPWTNASKAIAEALDDPAQASKVVGGLFGEQPFESLVGRLLCADTLIHTWDLARATNQEERLDPGAVAKAMEFLDPIDEAIRRPGGFGPKLEPAPDADQQGRLLAFCGRAV